MVAILACVIFTGCSGANITAVKWTGLSGPNVKTRCRVVNMRDDSEMNKVFSKYDGWKLVYISEFTTNHRIGTDGVACFERLK